MHLHKALLRKLALSFNVSARIVLVSAIASGQGKTSVCAALVCRFLAGGQRVKVFKTGADFIDPMILQHAARDEVEVLDTWMLGLEACQQKLSAAAAHYDVVLIEGVMGLYDGTPSAADLARTFGIPVLLVIDASAMAQTAGALVYGMQHFGQVDIAGVIANKVAGQGHADFIASSLRDCPLLGYLPQQPQCLPERHLGLVLPNEIDGLQNIVQELGESLQLDFEKWHSIAVRTIASLPVPHAPNSEADTATKMAINSSARLATVEKPLQGKTIAIARDAAFAFLYPANLHCLEELGATLLYFSPLANQKIPRQADALYLPGGYPELHAQTLSRATRWQASVRAAQGVGMPIWAECGGMMVLCENLIDQSGRCFAMAGLLPGNVQMRQFISAIGPQAWYTTEGELRGHSFHFSVFDSTLTPHARAQKHPSGQAGEAIFRLGRLQASYFHAYFPSCPTATAALFLASER